MPSILIVKTSSIGDVVQALSVLSYLHSKWSEVEIDWVVEKSLQPLLEAIPLIRTVHIIDTKQWRRKPWQRATFKAMADTLKKLRRKKYDYLFDLQGNLKSACITAFCRAEHKIGFGAASVQERGNLLATKVRIDPPLELNMVERYLYVLKHYFKDAEAQIGPIPIQLQPQDEAQRQLLKPEKDQLRIMVCFGSKWPNKRLTDATLTQLITQLFTRFNPHFCFIYSHAEEKRLAGQLNQACGGAQTLLGGLSLPLWAKLMQDMDLVLTMDSAALHLCALVGGRSFSFFGPSAAKVYKPSGREHGFYQGTCPYGQTFDKRCPKLRTCATGACLREAKSVELVNAVDLFLSEHFEMVLKRT